MYAGGRANVTARHYTRFWAAVFSRLPGRWVVLEIPGRSSGQLRRFPLGETRLNGDRFLVSMLGSNCNWVRNVKAADGLVTLRHGRAEAARLVEVPVDQRARILKRYVEQVPGARPHIPVDRAADVRAFETIAASYPVFRIVTGSRTQPPPVRAAATGCTTRCHARDHTSRC